MADPEKVKKTPEADTGGEKSGGAKARVPKEDKSVSGLDGFLRQIKLMMLMREKAPGSEDYEKLKEIEGNLSSSKPDEREKAKTAADELIAVFEGVRGEVQSSELTEVVQETFGDKGEKSTRAVVMAEKIDLAKKEMDAKVDEGKEATRPELEALATQLTEFKELVGFRAMSQEGMEMVEETTIKVAKLREVQRHIGSPLVYESPLAKKKAYFEEGSSDNKDDKRLRVRTAWDENGKKLGEKLERVKKTVKEVVIEQKRELSGQEAISALQDVSDLRAKLKNLVGKERERTLETLETLTAAESHLQAILVRKVVDQLRTKNPKIGQREVDAAVGEMLMEAKGGRFGGGRARYKFEDTFEKMAEVVETKAKRFEREWPKREPGEASYEDEFRKMSRAEQMMASEKMREEVEFYKRVESIRPVLSQMGVDYDPNDTKFEEALRAGGEQQALGRVEEIVRQARERGVPASRLKMGEQFLKSIAREKERTIDGKLVKVDFLDVKKRLLGYVEKQQYGRYIREMKAYVSRVGLRESSADFQFAIMLRDAKDVISILEPDIADEFEQWQGSLFVPPFTKVDPETWRGMFERVWSASNLDHVLNPAYANAAGMLVELPDGTKKMMSTAVFYQLLQRGDNATKFLNAPVDGTDSTSFRIWIDYLYGKGARWEGDLETGRVVDASGKELATMNTLLKIQGFDVKSKQLDGEDQDSFTLAEILDQSTWMHRYAENFFMYSGEAGKHMRHYPKEDMENANKWLFSQDQMFEGYGGHFGKYAAPFWQIAKLGHLLQEIRGYKDVGIFQKAMIEEMMGVGVEGKKAQEFAKMWTGKLKQKITVDGKTFEVGLLSIEEIRLIGNEWGSVEEAWAHAKDYLMAHNMPEEMIKDQKYIKEVLAKRARGEKLSDEEENWAKQAEEFFEMCKNLKWSNEKKKEYGGLSERELANSMTQAELAVFAKKKNTIFGGNWQPKNMKEFVEGFEFAAVMDPAKYLQATDPIEYAKKYAKLSEEVSKLLPKIESGTAGSPDFIEVQKALRAYLPPEQVDNFLEILVRKTIQSRTTQLLPYEVAKLNKDMRTIDYRYMEGKDGHKFYFIDRDGHRTAKTEKFRGNYMKDRWKVRAWRASDVEVLMDALHGEGMIPRKVGEEMLDDLVGGGRVLDKMLGLEKKSLSEKQVARRKFVKKVFARTKRLIQRLPLFDDPVWALFSLGAAYLNLFGEAAAEIAKAGE